jgi:diguanylate cyclase (GGDEF)-like protein/PAS domain S-box-containing protein
MRNLLRRGADSDPSAAAGMAPDLGSTVRSRFHGGPIQWLVLGGALLIVAIAIGTAAMVGSFRERALVNGERELENTVMLLARHFDQQLEQLDLVQKGMVEHIQSNGITSREALERHMSGRDVHQMLKTKIEALPHVGTLSLNDSDGKLISSSKSWPAAAVTIADRAYFKTLKSSPELTTVLSEPVLNHVTGTWTTVLARRLSGPDGAFLGVVLGSIQLAQFEDFFTSLALGEGAAISIFHRDGTLLARYPRVEAMIGRNFSTGPIFRNVLSKADYGTTRLDSPIDGQDRLGSARNSSHYPLTMIATTTLSAALADWRQQTRLLIGAAGSSVLVIAAMLFLIVRQLSRQHQRSRQRLVLEKERLDAAVNNMSQGLLLFDSAQRLVICNQRYIAMYGLSADVIKPGCSFHDVIAHRKETGSFQGDVEEYHSRVLRDIASRTVIVVDTADGRSIQITNHPLANGGWVATHEDITERKRTDERIAHLAHYDALTDLPNRVQFREQLQSELKRVHRNELLAVLYIDIDQFKSVNDSLGHQIGDELLKGVAARLKACVRESGFVARLGGDEFAIVQTAVRDAGDVTDLVARMYQAIREPHDCLGHQITTDASIGIALAPQDGTDLDQLLKHADLAMYDAKADGRRTYRFFEPGMDARVKARHQLELDLRHAIVTGEFEVHYQPIVDLKNDTVAGCEALLRWRHPERGMISPAEFIPIAEDAGLINELGDWVLSTACAEAARWPDNITLAVNVSPIQLKSQTMALKVLGALAATGLAANRLEIEITEAVLIRDDDTALAILHQLREVGVRVALDDFGTGYSSLSYLQRFPFDKIKIDRCFVNDIAEPGGSASIVEAVVNIASARHMTTTAEGVETEQQKELLRALGCTHMQGYLFSAARPAAEIRQLLGNKTSTMAVA